MTGAQVDKGYNRSDQDSINTKHFGNLKRTDLTWMFCSLCYFGLIECCQRCEIHFPGSINVLLYKIVFAHRETIVRKISFIIKVNSFLSYICQVLEILSFFACLRESCTSCKRFLVYRKCLHTSCKANMYERRA